MASHSSCDAMPLASDRTASRKSVGSQPAETNTSGSAATPGPVTLFVSSARPPKKLMVLCPMPAAASDSGGASASSSSSSASAASSASAGDVIAAPPAAHRAAAGRAGGDMRATRTGERTSLAQQSEEERSKAAHVASASA